VESRIPRVKLLSGSSEQILNVTASQSKNRISNNGAHGLLWGIQTLAESCHSSDCTEEKLAWHHHNLRFVDIDDAFSYLFSHWSWIVDTWLHLQHDFGLCVEASVCVAVAPGILPVIYSHWRLISFTYLLLWQGLRLISVLNSISSPVFTHQKCGTLPQNSDNNEGQKNGK